MEQVKVSRTERKKEATRKRIISVAMDLFNKQGVDQTTVEQIASEADINKGTIYNHFSAKEDIICEHVQQIIKEQGPEVISQLLQLPDTRSRLIAALHKSLEWMYIELNKDIYEKYYTYRMQASAQHIRDRDLSKSSGFKDVLTAIIRRDMHSLVLAHHLETYHCMMALYWLIMPDTFSINKIIEENVDLFLNGAKNRESKNE
jgi:AcrR family transcriptional regulator